MRDKLLSLRQNSWKRRFFILSKSSKGNYILKYLKGRNIKGSIAVDQYVTQMHHLFILSHVSALLNHHRLYRHLFLIEVLDPNPAEIQKRVPWAFVGLGCNLQCMIYVEVKILNCFDEIWYIYVSDWGEVVSTNQTSWLRDPKGCIPVVEDLLWGQCYAFTHMRVRMGYATLNCGTQPFPPYGFTKCFASCAEVSWLPHSPSGWCWLPNCLLLRWEIALLGSFGLVISFLSAQHPLQQGWVSLALYQHSLPCHTWYEIHREETANVKKM